MEESNEVNRSAAVRAPVAVPAATAETAKRLPETETVATAVFEIVAL